MGPRLSARDRRDDPRRARALSHPEASGLVLSAPQQDGPPQRALLILNAKARRGGDDDPRPQLRAAGIGFRDAGELGGRDDLDGAIRAHAGACDAVIVGGGDGTLNAASAALADTGLPLGVLPMGTANDFAKTVGIPLDVDKAIDIIAAGRTRAVDVGVANDRCFLNAASIGVSTRIARALKSRDKRRFGVLAYAVATARVLTQARPFRAEISADGQSRIIHAIQITVASGRHYGGAFTIREDAVADDGQLDLVAIRLRRWWRLLGLTPSLLRGRYRNERKVLTLRAPAITVGTRHAHAVDLDGDLLASTPVEFGIRPGAMRVFAPTDEA